MRLKAPPERLFRTPDSMDARTRGREIEKRRQWLKNALDSTDDDLSGLDDAEYKDFRRVNDELDELMDGFDGSTRHPGFPRMPGGRIDAGKTAALGPQQKLADWMRSEVKTGWRRDQEDLSLAKYLRGLATGDWSGAEPEQKGMTEGVLADGGHMVPTPLAGNVLDLARNQARVFQAGAATVPMTSQTLKIARQTGDSTATWHAEAQADISNSGITLDAVTLTARTLPVLCKLSVELFEDAPNVDAQVERSIAAVLALELDRVALYGTGVAPQPRGLKNATGVDEAILGGGANGQAPTNYDFVVDAIGNIRNANHEPTGAIDAPRTETTLAKLKTGIASDNTPLQPPDIVKQLPRYPTSQVPVNLTVGTSNDTSDMFVGDWAELLIGMRTSLTLQFLRERYLADTMEYAFFAYLRADVAVAHPAAFEIVTGIRP